MRWFGIRSSKSLALCLALATLPTQAVTVRASVDSASFTAEESRRLEAGELVLRPSVRSQGSLRLMGGSSWQVIDASPDVVWRALLDTPRYRRMMPRVLEARVVRAKNDVRTVFMRQGARGVLEASYYLNVKVHEPQRDITFAIDEHMPHDLLKAAWGFYTVRSYGKAKTLLAYGVMADIGGGPIVGLMRGSMHDWMLRTPWMIKRFVEGSGRHYYR
jgi:hypothetical protein